MHRFQLKMCRQLGFCFAAVLATLLPLSAVSQPDPASTPTAAEIAADQALFDEWKQSFKAEALASGISEDIYIRALGAVRPNAKVSAANDRQPEHTRQIWQYIDGAVSEARITKGRTLLVDHQGLFTRMERKYGVEARYLLSIWALESSYGAVTGNYNLFEALATLAYKGRRTDYGRTQLLAALKIAQRGDKPIEQLKGSWAGAMGQTQFIPTTYLQYAVDEDGDGKRDLFDSIPDIMASTANYLAESGWEKGQDWGHEVILPTGFDYSIADATTKRAFSEWAALGIKEPGGIVLPGSNTQAALFVPAGHKGPAFLTLQNFRAILKYNNSTAYALAIGHLADRIVGGEPIAGTWPRNERSLSLSERTQMQELLNKLGFNVGDADGIVGAMTRSGIRAFQKSQNLPADGFATVGLLDMIKSEAAKE